MNTLETIHQCRTEIPKLRAALETRGIKQPVFTEPKFDHSNPSMLIDLYDALSGEMNRLATRLQSEMSATPGAAPAPTPTATPAVAANATLAPAATAIALTSSEISRLTWTEKTQLAGGFLTQGKARELAQSRATGAPKISLSDECLAEKLAPKKSASDLKGKNLSEQCAALSTETQDRSAGRK